MEKYLINEETQLLQHAASKDEKLPSIQGIYFGEKCAYALNGHILAMRKYSPSEELPKGRTYKFSSPKQGKTNLVTAEIFSGDKELVGLNEKNTATEIDGQYPDVEQVIKYTKEALTEKEPITLTFSLEELKNLVAALGVSGSKDDKKRKPVTLQFVANEDGLVVNGIAVDTGTDSVGILMPCKSDPGLKISNKF